MKIIATLEDDDDDDDDDDVDKETSVVSSCFEDSHLV